MCASLFWTQTFFEFVRRIHCRFREHCGSPISRFRRQYKPGKKETQPPHLVDPHLFASRTSEAT